ncbi:MAG: GGDEF domain-containing protein [Lachnospiraceae bacterium]|nr:GGDEF domain-containing protein [Lachnospiraceae bacterium]
MKNPKKIKSEGISLKTANIIMIFATLVVLVMLLVELFQASSVYKKLSSATDDYILMHKSAENLMAASDFLTDRVQLFTINLEEKNMTEYFNEVHNTRRRDIALFDMEKIAGKKDAFKQLDDAMYMSNDLMNVEIHAMKLICEAKGIETKKQPEELQRIDLSDFEKELPNAEKISKAQDLVHDSDYYTQKAIIRDKVEKCSEVLIEDTHQTQDKLSTKLKNKLKYVRILLIIMSFAMVMVLWMTSYLGINPILKGVQKIKENSKIPVTGSYEFRYLAKTYNKMYEAFKQSIENLNYEASHDSLTGVYNRAGYDIVKQSLDLKSTAVLIIDADNFKKINDMYGHLVGDQVLKKLADALRAAFRSEDYICRVGGDEFVVFMIHMQKEQKELIESKAALINKKLSDRSDGLPYMSVSIGVAFGATENDIESIISHADEALYKVKKDKSTNCYFYELEKK